MSTFSGFDTPKSWQRFTLLDILLLQVAFGIGCSVAFVPLEERTGQIPAGLAQRSVMAALVGAVVAGPIILLAQRLLRGRRGRLSAGEWLWLSPFAVGLVGAAGTLILLAIFWRAGSPLREDVLGALVLAAIFLAALVIFLESVCALASLAILIAVILGGRGVVPCAWTDRFGSATCFLLGLALLVFHAMQ